MGHDPVISILFGVVYETLLKDVANRGYHLFLDIAHPEFDITVLRVDSLDELDFLSLNGHHCHHAVIVTELQISNSFEHFSEMASHTTHFFSLGQDLKQVII